MADVSTMTDTDDRNLMLINSQTLGTTFDGSDKTRDQKTFRRLAQNRVAARKSRLRKKLESSRMKLTQLEQDLQQARKQGIFISSSGDQSQSMSGNGMWRIPAERCFLWLGGFRKSELLKLLINQLEPLTEQQLLAINNLQESSQQGEDALSQGIDSLQQSLAETLAGSLGPSGSSGNVANYMGQMAMAMGKLGTLEGFIHQADNLRQQALQRMHCNLTTCQSARAFLAIGDYFSRLRALSSLWLARLQE